MARVDSLGVLLLPGQDVPSSWGDAAAHRAVLQQEQHAAVPPLGRGQRAQTGIQADRP